MVKKEHRTDVNKAKLLLLMGRLLALMNEAEPLPEGNRFVEEFQKELQAISTSETAQNLRAVASMVQKALRLSTYTEVDNTLRQAIHSMKELVGENENGIVINDPLKVGKQVIYRMYQEGENIIYGTIESSIVFPSSATYDTWVVEVQPGFQLNAESNAFVLYDGPKFQPGEQVFYLKSEQQPIKATILGPGFVMRGCAGFNISFQKGGKEDHRYAIPYTDLSYDA